jgi:FtsZ-binding cell division protein ZapB
MQEFIEKEIEWNERKIDRNIKEIKALQQKVEELKKIGEKLKNDTSTKQEGQLLQEDKK